MVTSLGVIIPPTVRTAGSAATIDGSAGRAFVAGCRARAGFAKTPWLAPTHKPTVTTETNRILSPNSARAIDDADRQ